MLKLLQTIDKGDDALRRKRSKATVLLQFRELYGKMLSFNECKCNFQQEYQKLQASQPTVCIFNVLFIDNCNFDLILCSQSLILF